MKKIALILLLLIGGKSWAQQYPLYNLYMFNILGVNPGYMYADYNHLNVNLTTRNQWAGFEGAPTTYIFVLNSLLKNQKIELNLRASNDIIGPARDFNIQGAFNYKLKINKREESLLGLGLQVGVLNKRYDWDMVTYKDQEFDAGTLSSSFYSPTIDFGAYYREANWFVGLSFHNLYPAKTVLSDEDTVSLNSKLLGNYVLTGGYAFKISEKYSLKISSLFAADNTAKLFLNLNASVSYDDKFLLGLGGNPTGTLIAFLKVRALPKLEIGYGYEHNLNTLSQLSSVGGSHEIFVAYKIKIRNSTIIRSPRGFF